MDGFQPRGAARGSSLPRVEANCTYTRSFSSFLLKRHPCPWSTGLEEGEGNQAFDCSCVAQVVEELEKAKAEIQQRDEVIEKHRLLIKEYQSVLQVVKKAGGATKAFKQIK